MDYVLMEDAGSIHFSDLNAMLDEIEPGTIVSRTFYKDARLKAVLFGFDAGQVLHEHSSIHPATIQVIAGEADITLGAATITAGPGCWLHMPARLRHQVAARTPLVMLLTLLTGDDEED